MTADLVRGAAGQFPVITWATTKTPSGTFEFRVYAFGHRRQQENLKVGAASTRARATGAAKQWTRHFKAVQARLLAGQPA